MGWKPTHGSRKLRGLEQYRLRVGVYRILYTVDDSNHMVEVVAVGYSSAWPIGMRSWRGACAGCAYVDERDLARTRLTAALAKRESLTHSVVSDTRAERTRLGV